MTPRPASSQQPGARKVGYLVAIIVNVILLVLVNVRPGWREVSFLTESFVGVLWLVNLSIVASVVVNVAYLGYDPAWFRSVGQMSVSVIGLAAAVRLWQVFPFDFSGYAFNWTPVARLLLALGIFGTTVAIVTEIVRLTGRGMSAGAHSRPSDDDDGQLRGSGP